MSKTDTLEKLPDYEEVEALLADSDVLRRLLRRKLEKREGAAALLRDVLDTASIEELPDDLKVELRCRLAEDDPAS